VKVGQEQRTQRPEQPSPEEAFAQIARLMEAAGDDPAMIQRLSALLGKRLKSAPRKLGTKIFISYRRNDAQWIVGPLYDKLAAAFGNDAVFLDVDKIPEGVNFRAHIDEILSECFVLLAVIAGDWLNERRGVSLKDNPEDFVRLELELAMHHSVRIIPLLFQNASMPRPEQLPPSLQEFRYLNAPRFDTPRDFQAHVGRLLNTLKELQPAEE
jgi:hypothetical protein